ncbi:hypothetical protein BDFB_002265 [Asbolus verrucosus]|uniref:Uncharacterized protein n=1 Tax=Asbolus verrucosus TaxID=1661398 RepID=A0A482VVN2_ASBVE|nr:hypothetical protein BDFB_002265 [Asbolus verrucosus]
MQSPRSFCV